MRGMKLESYAKYIVDLKSSIHMWVYLFAIYFIAKWWRVIIVVLF